MAHKISSLQPLILAARPCAAGNAEYFSASLEQNNRKTAAHSYWDCAAVFCVPAHGCSKDGQPARLAAHPSDTLRAHGNPSPARPWSDRNMKFGARVASGCRWQRVVLLWALAGMAPAHALDAASLTARHTALREQLASNPFKRPLYLESLEAAGRLKGDIYTQIEQPFGEVAPALQGMDRWCDILILHLNVKGCRASSPKAGDRLSVSIGRKFDQPLGDAYGFEFLYRVVTASADYLQVVLSADEGPLGTSAYRVVLEVVPLDARRSFLHLSYAYAYGMTARLAMQGYLGTIGRNKVGFSVTGHTADGRPVYIAGTRGVIERNTMRYYLAIEAYLGALSAPAAQQAERRLNAWFDGVERYPAQLHEMERGEYLDMKRREIARQQAPGPTAAAK